MNLKIKFGKIPHYYKKKRCVGLYYDLKDKQGPLILISDKVIQLDQIEFLYHEFTHFVHDLFENMKFENSKTSKIITLIKDNKDEEKLCKKIQKFALKEFKQYLKDGYI